MKQFLRTAALLLGMLLAAAPLGGCNGGAADTALDPNSPVTVTLWHYYVGENQQALERSVSGFNQTIGIEQGVIIESVAMGSISELEAAVTASAMGVINAAAMPQLFSSYADKALEIDELGMVANLSEYFTQQEKDAYVDDFLADGVFDEGRLPLVPIVKSTELTYVNATAWNAFAAAGSRTTQHLTVWEHLYETAREYYNWVDAATPEQPWDGKGLLGFDSVANFIIIGCRQMGVEVIDAAAGENGAAVLDTDALRRVFNIYYSGISLGYFDQVGKFRSDDIKSGDLIAYVGSSSSAAYFPTWIEQDNSEAPIDFMPLPYPVFEGGQSTAIQQGAGMCVAKSTPAQQQGAVLFLKWFTATQQNIPFAMTTGYLPVQQAAYGSTAFDQALDDLRAGDKAARNVAGVYDIALHQITEQNTYAARPFTGSYTVRSILQASLIEAGQAGRGRIDALKAEGAGEAELLQALDTDAAFAAWLNTVRAGLDENNITHI